MKTITNIVYNFVRKQLAKNNMGQGKGITSLPNSMDIEIGMTNIYNNLRKGGFDAVSAGKAIKSEDDLARTLSEIKQKEISDQQFFNQDPNRLDIIIDKMNKGIPLNKGDQFALEGSGFETKLDAFKGFEPKVIQGGKSEKELLEKMNKQNKEAVERIKKRKDTDPDKKAMGGLMRLGMFAGGTPLRRLLQYLAGTSGKKGSENLKDLNVSDQLKFFAEKQGFNPDQAKIEYLEQVLDTLKKDKDLIKSAEPSPAKNELENIASKAFRESFIDMTQSGRFKGLTSDMIDKSILETETILKNLKTGGRKLNAEGGLTRLGFANGSPPSIKLFPRAQGKITDQKAGTGGNAPNITLRDIDYGITGLIKDDKFFGGAEIDKGKVKIDVVSPEGNTLFKDTISKDDAINFILGAGDPIGDKFQIKTDKDFKNMQITVRKKFEKGSPPSKGRRNFLKLMGGLAALPVVGKFFKFAKPASTAVQAAKEATDVPSYFPKLVEKIKLLGDDVTSTAATGERQVVKEYKGYELTESLDTGSLRGR
jgi:hypothetical protein